MLLSFVSPHRTSHQRDAAIDIARGIAIMLMVYGNMGPVLREPHPMLMRFSCSFVAPLFVMLAGMMLARGIKTKTWRGIGKRVGMLFFWAAFTDMAAWGIRPFLGVDVLYLIAMGTLVAYLLRDTPMLALGAITAGIVLDTPLLQGLLGYTTYPTEMELFSGSVTVTPVRETPVWHHYIVDGWFPLFPWLSYMLLGIMLGRHRWEHGQARPLPWHKWRLHIAACLAAGLVLWWLQPGAMYSRQGFSELFYPPTIGFFITSASVAILVLMFADKTHQSRWWHPVRFMGQHSLFVYVVHSLVIGRLFARWWQGAPLENGPFLLTYAMFMVALFMITLAMCALKSILAKRLHKDK
jgi:uncharacterized membrane protein